MRLFSKLVGGVAVGGLLALSGCNKASDAPAGTPAVVDDKATPAPTNTNVTTPANGDPKTQPKVDEKPLAPVSAEVEAANKIVDKVWAYFEKNYNQGGPDSPKDDEGMPIETWGPKANSAFTAFVVLGGLRSGKLKANDAKTGDSVKSILDRQQSNGSFDVIPGTGFKAVYTTSVCVELLAWLRDNGDANWKSKVGAATNLAMDYLKRSQVGSPTGPLADSKPESDIHYGGWAYSEEELKDAKNGKKPRSNMSTSIFALDASAAFGLSKDDPLWTAATAFLQRNQNSSEIDKGIEIKNGAGNVVGEPPAGSPNEGGSRYSPATSKAGEVTQADGTVLPISYGSMTYALLRGYLHSGLPKTDKRVRLAWKWLMANFDVTKVTGFVNTDKTPDADQQGYYYQFMQMSRTLTLFGESKFQDAKGNERNWQMELVTQVAKLQKPDGSFKNDHEDNFSEGNSVLCASYILNAMAEIVGPTAKK